MRSPKRSLERQNRDCVHNQRGQGLVNRRRTVTGRIYLVCSEPQTDHPKMKASTQHLHRRKRRLWYSTSFLTPQPSLQEALFRGRFAHATHPNAKNRPSKPSRTPNRGRVPSKAFLRAHTLKTNIRRYHPSNARTLRSPRIQSPLPALHRIETHVSKPNFKVLLH